MSFVKDIKRSDISPFLVMEAFREAHEVTKTGADVIHLSLGQPASKPPQQVLQKVAERMMEDKLGYTDACGIPALRERIAKHYRDEYGLEVPAERVFITIGSSAAFFLSMLCAFNPGDKLAIARPCYPAYPNMMKALDLVPVYLHTTTEDNFQPTVAMLEALPEKPQGLVIASPSNPSGTVIGPKRMKQLVEYCEQHGIRLISDEIYHGVTYGQRETSSVLEHSQQMIIINSFSKYYLLPGWRLGWVVMPENLCRPYETMLQNFFISPPAIAQHAALAVFECKDELDEVVRGYAVNRQILLDELPKAGFNELSPAEGAFYIYANVSSLTNDSREFCRRMLNEAHVCAVAGLDFDKESGHAYVRFSFAGETAEIREAMERLKRWMNKTA
ncbi:MAG: aminotransferase class I/II-fold pyridoxal phosphate-dependent enzyme [Ketobacter sp.]|nr:aminotransferase class I/II-fold pyridoxal phosphate-dependent enzyme [Ketobacter sp.]